MNFGKTKLLPFTLQKKLDNTQRSEAILMPIYSISEAPQGHYFMGVSLISNVFFSKKTVKEYYDALEKKALSFLIILADSLEMWNYAYFQGLPLAEARQKAIAIGKQYQLGYLKLSKVIPNFSVLLTSEIETDDTVKRINGILLNTYVENEHFRKAVKLQVMANIGNKLKQKGVDDVPELLTNYVLGEIAIAVGIYSGIYMERQIQVSPRSDKLLEDLYNNAFPELSRSLSIKPSEFQYVVYNSKARRNNNEYI